MAQTKESLNKTVAKQRETIKELQNQRRDLWKTVLEKNQRIKDLREDVDFYKDCVARLSSILATYMEEEAPQDICTTVRLCPNYQTTPNCTPSTALPIRMDTTLKP